MQAALDTREQLWDKIHELSPGPHNRLALGRAFFELRHLYSDRNSGGHRLTSGHGLFESEIQKRSRFSSRAVRDMIFDFEAHLNGGPSTAAKRKLRRAKLPVDALTEFVRLLPFHAAQVAYREAAKLYHPDHGGSNKKMQQLNFAWERARNHFTTK
jgi:hypothetical protein